MKEFLWDCLSYPMEGRSRNITAIKTVQVCVEFMAKITLHEDFTSLGIQVEARVFFRAVHVSEVTVRRMCLS